MIASVYIHIPVLASASARIAILNRMPEGLRTRTNTSRACFRRWSVRAGNTEIWAYPRCTSAGGRLLCCRPISFRGCWTARRAFFRWTRTRKSAWKRTPGTVDAAKLRAFRSAGVNRISFGAQASQTGLLALLGRVHTWPEAVLAVDDAFEAGISNINLDLMYALPGQTAEDFAETLDAALSLPVSHLSCYSLILEEGTPLTRRVEAGTLPEPRDEDSVRMQRLALEKTRAAGMERYEISNYARPALSAGTISCTGSAETTSASGCAAHSMMNDERFFNPDYRAYLSGAPQSEREPVRGTEKMEETLLLGLRMTKGISLAAFERAYGKACADALRREIRPLADGGLARLADGRFAPDGGGNGRAKRSGRAACDGAGTVKIAQFCGFSRINMYFTCEVLTNYPPEC